MITYKNNGENRNSGIVGYKSGGDYINIYFKDGSLYRYTTFSCGYEVLKHMQALARQGSELNGFISRNLPEYSYKERKAA